MCYKFVEKQGGRKGRDILSACMERFKAPIVLCDIPFEKQPFMWQAGSLSATQLCLSLSPACARFAGLCPMP